MRKRLLPVVKCTLNSLVHLQAFKAAEEEVQGRWKYEDNIKRPYFHMKPLERGQVGLKPINVPFSRGELSSRWVSSSFEDWFNTPLPPN